jgi:predicted Rdx family selenoprotein
MSNEITIDICSNCQQHAWCTRHNEATYLTLAEELRKCILSNISDAVVKINLVGGQKMGSFEVICKGITLFSKLELGYFPHTTFLTSRIVTFIDDANKGNDLNKYKYSNSPIKHHPTFTKEYSQSPKKTSVTPNLMVISGSKNKKNEGGINSAGKIPETKHEEKK